MKKLTILMFILFCFVYATQKCNACNEPKPTPTPSIFATETPLLSTQLMKGD